MGQITYRDRETGKLHREKVYGQFFLKALYRAPFFSQLFSFSLLPLLAKVPFFSKLYGHLQKSSASRKKIEPFVKKFGVDSTEFEKPLSHFHSFNDFFIRKLKPSSRPLATGADQAILPADGRYLVFPSLSKTKGIYIKGKIFDLRRLIKDRELFDTYREGSLVIARLCPVDYHRFHFPCACTPSSAQLINGPLYSVNPLALRKQITILSENKRMVTRLVTTQFREILYMEIGATFVGSIHQTYTPQVLSQKGEEKGYFEFGGSCILLFFQPSTIEFESDLIASSGRQIETKGKMGQPLGRSLLS